MNRNLVIGFEAFTEMLIVLFSAGYVALSYAVLAIFFSVFSGSPPPYDFAWGLVVGVCCCVMLIMSIDTFQALNFAIAFGVWTLGLPVAVRIINMSIAGIIYVDAVLLLLTLAGVAAGSTIIALRKARRDEAMRPALVKLQAAWAAAHPGKRKLSGVRAERLGYAEVIKLLES